MAMTLYIDGQLADLGSAREALILWTYTREQADAPAAVKNGFTKTVTLPGTPSNHLIFSHIYRFDHVTGARFDPLARTPFVLMDAQSAIVERGYVKLDMIHRRGPAVISYDVTLYGGLGSFLFGLTYNADGSKKTLADLYWPLSQYEDSVSDVRDFEYGGVPQAWRYITEPERDYRSTVYGLLNFAPAYNGYPDKDFDADKAYYAPGAAASNQLTGIEIPYTDPDDGTVYRPSSNLGWGGVLISLGNKVTEWEAQDLRESQQRPCFSIERFLKALTARANTGDWTFKLANDKFFGYSSNPFLSRGWITLPYPDKSYIYAFDEFRYLGEYLGVSLTPADYLLGLAKTFGLAFIVDKARQEVTLTARDEYYILPSAEVNGMMDFSARVATDRGIDIRPYIMDARIYDFSSPVPGAFAKSYKDRFGREYGSFRLDTSYGFDSEAVDVMKSVPFRGAADVSERSAWYFVQRGELSSQNTFKFYRYGTSSYTLYSGDKSKKINIEPVGRLKEYYWRSEGGLPMPQFHDENNKPADGAHCMLFFVGAQSLATMTTNSRIPVRWHLSCRNQEMLELNNGRECWNISPENSADVQDFTKLPLFRRWIEPGRMSWQVPTFTMDFGAPEETGVVSEEPTNDGIFRRAWEVYLSDRYDRDTVQMTAWVDLNGLRVDESLLRHFIWYDGAVWTINRIIDYNPAGRSLTQVEFIAVKDTANYTAGQNFQ